MKKIIIALALLSTVGTAHSYGNHHHHHGHYRGYSWVAPLAIGGIIGYGLSRPYYAPPVVIQQPVYVQQQPQIVQDPPIGYHWQLMIDPATNQQRPVFVPN